VRRRILPAPHRAVRGAVDDSGGVRPHGRGGRVRSQFGSRVRVRREDVRQPVPGRAGGGQLGHRGRVSDDQADGQSDHQPHAQSQLESHDKPHPRPHRRSHHLSHFEPQHRAHDKSHFEPHRDPHRVAQAHQVRDEEADEQADEQEVGGRIRRRLEQGVGRGRLAEEEEVAVSGK
ncbi:hypothetical protein ACHAWF_011440, partial [Thalassiosira exigua]